MTLVWVPDHLHHNAPSENIVSPEDVLAMFSYHQLAEIMHDNILKNNEGKSVNAMQTNGLWQDYYKTQTLSQFHVLKPLNVYPPWFTGVELPTCPFPCGNLDLVRASKFHVHSHLIYFMPFSQQLLNFCHLTKLLPHPPKNRYHMIKGNKRKIDKEGSAFLESRSCFL